jgi:hypothetical protein
VKIALFAGLCMIIQDSLAVIKYQAAARNRGWVTAGADVIIWMVSITSTTIAAFTLHGNNFGQKVAVVICISCANVIGNLLGTWLGEKFVTDEDEEEQDALLIHLEQRIKKLEEWNVKGRR